MIFKRMSLEQAKEFYRELKEVCKSSENSLMKIAMDDIWFFTDGLTKDYRRLKTKDASKVINGVEHKPPLYIQLSLDI